MAKFSKRSKDALVGVKPALVRVLEAAIVNTPHDFTVNEGARTAATQRKYYSWGRTVVNPNTGPIKGNKFGAIVTKRDGVTKKSEHQPKADGYGYAVDLAIFKRDKNGKGYLDFNDDKAYTELAIHIKTVAACEGVPIIWGGDWKTIEDKPHFETK